MTLDVNASADPLGVRRPKQSSVWSGSHHWAATRRASQFPLEAIFVVVTFIVALGVAFPPPPPAGLADVALEPQHPIQKFVWLLIRAGILFYAWRNRAGVVALIRRTPFMSLLVAAAILSTLWSDTPVNTLKQSIYIALCALFSYYLAARFSRAQIVRYLTTAVAVALVLSILELILIPQVARYVDLLDGEAARGAFMQKNPFGRCASLGVILFGWHAYRLRSAWWAAAAFVAFGLLVASQSATALLATVLVGAVLVTNYLIKRGAGYLIAAGVCVAMAALVTAWAFGLDVYGMVLQSVGRDESLTGRSSFWPYVITGIKDEPWLGYGVSGFWRGWDGPESAAVWQFALSHPTHAHNGLFDLALDLGALGVGLFFASAVQLFHQALRTFRTSRLAIDLWPIAYLAYILFVSVAESVLLKPTSVYWMLYAFAAASAAGAIGSVEKKKRRLALRSSIPG